jgi:hypothetical protein
MAAVRVAGRRLLLSAPSRIVREACNRQRLLRGGDDLRKLPLSMRKANLDRLQARRPDGIFVSDFEQGEIGPDLFARYVNSGLRVWFRSSAIGHTAAVVRTLDQGEEPQAPRNGACGGIVLLDKQVDVCLSGVVSTRRCNTLS